MGGGEGYGEFAQVGRNMWECAKLLGRMRLTTRRGAREEMDEERAAELASASTIRDERRGRTCWARWPFLGCLSCPPPLRRLSHSPLLLTTHLLASPSIKSQNANTLTPSSRPNATRTKSANTTNSRSASPRWTSSRRPRTTSGAIESARLGSVQTRWMKQKRNG